MITQSRDPHATPLITFFLPGLFAGGAERVVMALSGEIAKRGYRCDLVVAQPGGRWESRVPVGVRHVAFKRTKPLYAVPQLIEYLRREQPAALLSSILSANFAAIISCALARTATRCVVREAYPAGEDVISKSLITTIVNKIALRILYRKADAVVALSDELGLHVGTVARIPGHKVHVIPNPLIKAESSVSSIDALPENDTTPIIFACGRLEPQKDFETLLRAFAVVYEQRSVRLVIAGEGSQRGRLTQLCAELGINDAVILVGHAQSPQAWMKRAKIFVSSAIREGFPNVLLEALNCGCQVISTNSSDAVYQILDEGRLGQIVPVGDTHALAAGMQSILDGIASYPPATAHLKAYDLDAIATRYLALLTNGKI